MRKSISKDHGPEAFLERVNPRLNSGKSQIIIPRSQLELSSNHLRNNYTAIREWISDLEILPMVKADAYGHGMVWVAKVLAPHLGLYGFGVATLEEGRQLREGLGRAGARISIVVFSDTAPWSIDKGQFCQKYGLTPVVATDSDWTEFCKQGWFKKLPYEVQFNTGMNRLGISMTFLGTVVRDLQGKVSGYPPAGVFSHLSMSESPDSKLSRLQIERFRLIRGKIEPVVPSVRFHLGNSGGIWNQKDYDLRNLTDVVRPGLSLYGIPPWQGAPSRGIFPVMAFKASVVAVHRMKPGDAIGYGGTYQVKGNQTVSAAILGAGYADGVRHSLGNRGFVWLEGACSRFLGMVSMDLCAVQCSEKTKVGEWAEIFGPHMDLWAQAKLAGTLPYELLTSISSRVTRIYDANGQVSSS